MPQGSVLGPNLHLTYTYDNLSVENVKILATNKLVDWFKFPKENHINNMYNVTPNTAA